MFFKTFKPHRALEKYIRYYWVLEAPKISTGFSREFLTEGFELFFNLGDPVDIAMKDSSIKTVQSTSVSGPLTKPMVVNGEGKLHIFGVCFRPGGAYSFFKYPAHELTNYLADIDDLLEGKNKEIEESFLNLPSGKRVGHLNNFFLELIENDSDKLIFKAIEIIDYYKGLVNIKSLAKFLNISSRQLERKFKERVGLTPKQLCRSLRFKNVLSVKTHNPKEPWISAALDSGYYDQAHMVNDFKHFTGETPSAYFKNLKDPFSSLLIDVVNFNSYQKEDLCVNK